MLEEARHFLMFRRRQLRETFEQCQDLAPPRRWSPLRKCRRASARPSAPTPGDRTQDALRTAERGKPLGALPRDKRFEPGTDESGLLLDPGQPAGAREELIINDQRGPHMHEYAWIQHTCQWLTTADGRLCRLSATTERQMRLPARRRPHRFSHMGLVGTLAAVGNSRSLRTSVHGKPHQRRRVAQAYLTGRGSRPSSHSQYSRHIASQPGFRRRQNEGPNGCINVARRNHLRSQWPSQGAFADVYGRRPIVCAGRDDPERQGVQGALLGRGESACVDISGQQHRSAFAKAMADSLGRLRMSPPETAEPVVALAKTGGRGNRTTTGPCRPDVGERQPGAVQRTAGVTSRTARGCSGIRHVHGEDGTCTAGVETRTLGEHHRSITGASLEHHGRITPEEPANAQQPFPPELLVVVSAWPTLPEEIRANIVALAESHRTKPPAPD